MENTSKKELKNLYKSAVKIGGVFCIKCNGNGHIWIKSTTNIPSQKNRFEFSILTNSCLEPGMNAEWKEFGAKSFSFDILEEIQKKETQTEREFVDDIGVLLEMWLESHKQADLE